jgi:hypothetical protein
VPSEEVFVYSTVEDPYSHYSAACDCWYVYSPDDSDTQNQFFFDGFAPPPPPACKDHQDNDGDGFYDYPADQDCTSPDDNNEGPHAVPLPPSAKLSIYKARKYALKYVDQRYASFSRRRLDQIDCVRRTDTQVRCGINWHKGHTFWLGHVTVRMSQSGKLSATRSIKRKRY